MYSKKLLLCKSIPIGLGLIAGAFTFYYFLPFYLSGIHTRAVVVSRRDLCTEFAYTDLSGLSHRLCKKLDEKDIGSDDQLDIWYLYDSPEETLEISPGAILLGSSTGVIFVVFCVFASLWWTWWRLNRWAEFERVKLELIDLALPWSNPFGLGSICSRSMKTYRVLPKLSDS
jgi:hypothetical protein